METVGSKIILHENLQVCVTSFKSGPRVSHKPGALERQVVINKIYLLTLLIFYQVYEAEISCAEKELSLQLLKKPLISIS